MVWRLNANPTFNLLTLTLTLPLVSNPDPNQEPGEVWIEVSMALPM